MKTAVLATRMNSQGGSPQFRLTCQTLCAVATGQANATAGNRPAAVCLGKGWIGQHGGAAEEGGLKDIKQSACRRVLPPMNSLVLYGTSIALAVVKIFRFSAVSIQGALAPFQVFLAVIAAKGRLISAPKKTLRSHVLCYPSSLRSK